MTTTIALAGCPWCGAERGLPCTLLTSEQPAGYEHTERVREADKPEGSRYLGGCNEGSDFMGGMCGENAYTERYGFPYCPEHAANLDRMDAYDACARGRGGVAAMTNDESTSLLMLVQRQVRADRLLDEARAKLRLARMDVEALEVASRLAHDQVERAERTAKGGGIIRLV